MKKYLFTLVCGLLALLLPACSLLQAVALKDCNYTYDKLSDVSLCGYQGKDMVSIGGIAAITKALLGKTETIPLDMTIHMNVENPNQTTAALEQLYYKVALDSVEIAQGNTTQGFTVPGGETAKLPLRISVDLKQSFTGEKRTVLTKALKNMAGINADPTEVTVQIRPTVRLGSGVVTSPRYIPIRFMYTGKNGNK